MAQIIYPNDKGMVLLYDGTEIYIVDFEFSADGKTYWEKHYKSTDHEYQYDNTIIVGGHKYIRFKRAGSTEWEAPAKFIGENGTDGDNLELQVENTLLQYKLSEETTWTTLFDLEDLRGEQGPMGQGWAIDNAGGLDVRGNCCGETTTNTCTSCNPNSVAASCGISTYLSLGNHRINSTDVLNETTYWHSVDGVVWVQSTDDNVGEYVTAWRATDGTGTAALTINSQGYEVAFASLVTPYISKGRVYACADGMWTEVMNIVTPTGYVKVSSSDGLQFLEAKVDDVTLEAYDSGVGYNDNIRIKDLGVNEDKLNASVAGNGLIGGAGVPLAIVNTGGITVNPDDIAVNVDDATIEIDGGTDEIQVKDEGITGPKIATGTTPVFNINKGFDVTNIDSTGAEVNPDETSLGFNGGGELEIVDNGVQGIHLNDDTCDNTKGVEISNDKIVVKVDDTTIEFNGSGQLQVIESYIQSLIDAGVVSLVAPGEPSMTGDIIFNASNDSSLISLSVAGSGATDGTITFSTDVDDSALTTFITNVINSVVTDATTYAKLKNILVAGSGITLTPNDGLSTITIASTATPPTAGSVAELDGTLDDGALDTYARADHTHSVADGALTIAKTSGLQTELDSKIELNTAYGSGQVSSTGLLVQSPNGSWFQIQVNDNGDLDTRRV